jgi:hypothetical protein
MVNAMICFPELERVSMTGTVIAILSEVFVVSITGAVIAIDDFAVLPPNIYPAS